MANGNSRAARSARARLQLRDSKGRWIEMGRSRVKWYSSKQGKDLVGLALEVTPDGKNAIVQTDDGLKHAVSGKSMTVVNAKVVLPGGKSSDTDPKFQKKQAANLAPLELPTTSNKEATAAFDNAVDLITKLDKVAPGMNKVTSDKDGADVHYGDLVQHDKKGLGFVTGVYPSTNSAQITFANGKTQIAKNHLFAVKDKGTIVPDVEESMADDQPQNDIAPVTEEELINEAKEVSSADLTDAFLDEQPVGTGIYDPESGDLIAGKDVDSWYDNAGTDMFKEEVQDKTLDLATVMVGPLKKDPETSDAAAESADQEVEDSSETDAPAAEEQTPVAPEEEAPPVSNKIELQSGDLVDGSAFTEKDLNALEPRDTLVDSEGRIVAKRLANGNWATDDGSGITPQKALANVNDATGDLAFYKDVQDAENAQLSEPTYDPTTGVVSMVMPDGSVRSAKNSLKKKFAVVARTKTGDQWEMRLAQNDYNATMMTGVTPQVFDGIKVVPVKDKEPGNSSSAEEFDAPETPQEETPEAPMLDEPSEEETTDWVKTLMDVPLDEDETPETPQQLAHGAELNSQDLTADVLESLENNDVLLNEEGLTVAQKYNGALSNRWGQTNKSAEQIAEDLKAEGTLRVHKQPADDELESPVIAQNENGTINFALPDGNVFKNYTPQKNMAFGVFRRSKSSGTWSSTFSGTQEGADKTAQQQKVSYDKAFVVPFKPTTELTPEEVYRSENPQHAGEVVPNSEENPAETIDTAPVQEVESGTVDETKVPGTDIDRTEPFALDEEKFAPTRQQQDVIDAVMAGKDTLVQARAGAGKTSTLEAISRRIEQFRDNEQILYIAFNKSVQKEAEGRMPDNVEARTGHSLAYNWAPEWMKNRMGGGTGPNGKSKGAQTKKNALRRPDEIAAHIGLTDKLSFKSELGEDDEMTVEEQATQAVRAVNKYATSAEDTIGFEHLPEAVQDLPEAIQQSILESAEKVWADLSSEDGKINFSFDHSRKHWALTRPDLSVAGNGNKKAAKVLFLDEAQDTPPVLAKVVADQNIQKVIVGDADQAIYGFTGAVDFLSEADHDVELPLNKSWRFGPQIADAGNRYLQMLGSKGRVIGGGPESKLVDGMEDADAILTRSNGGMINEIMRELDNGRKVGVPKNTKADLKRLFDHAADLQAGKPVKNLHEDLASFRKWDDFQEAVAKGDDPKITMIGNLINDKGLDELRATIEQVYDPGENGDGNFADKAKIDPDTGIVSNAFMLNKNLKEKFQNYGMGAYGYKWNGPDKTWVPKDKTPAGIQKAISSLQAAIAEGDGVEKVDVTVSTAHKAKGLEWGRVRIGGDFRGPEVDKETGQVKSMPSPEELRLAYVAVTRAESELDVGSLGWVYEYTEENGGTSESTSGEGSSDSPVQDSQAPVTKTDVPTVDAPVQQSISKNDANVLETLENAPVGTKLTPNTQYDVYLAFEKVGADEWEDDETGESISSDELSGKMAGAVTYNLDSKNPTASSDETQETPPEEVKARAAAEEPIATAPEETMPEWEKELLAGQMGSEPYDTPEAAPASAPTGALVGNLPEGFDFIDKEYLTITDFLVKDPEYSAVLGPNGEKFEKAITGWNNIRTGESLKASELKKLVKATEGSWAFGPKKNVFSVPKDVPAPEDISTPAEVPTPAPATGKKLTAKDFVAEFGDDEKGKFFKDVEGNKVHTGDTVSYYKNKSTTYDAVITNVSKGQIVVSVPETGKTHIAQPHKLTKKDTETSAPETVEESTTDGEQIPANTKLTTDTLSQEALASAPVGTTITAEDGWNNFTKLGDGNWSDEGGEGLSDGEVYAMITMNPHHGYSIGPITSEEEEYSFNPNVSGELTGPLTEEELKSLPVGSGFNIGGTLEPKKNTFVKQANGEWKVISHMDDPSQKTYSATIMKDAATVGDGYISPSDIRPFLAEKGYSLYPVPEQEAPVAEPKSFSEGDKLGNDVTVEDIEGMEVRAGISFSPGDTNYFIKQADGKWKLKSVEDSPTAPGYASSVMHDSLLSGNEPGEYHAPADKKPGYTPSPALDENFLSNTAETGDKVGPDTYGVFYVKNGPDEWTDGYSTYTSTDVAELLETAPEPEFTKKDETVAVGPKALAKDLVPGDEIDIDKIGPVNFKKFPVGQGIDFGDNSDPVYKLKDDEWMFDNSSVSYSDAEIYGGLEDNPKGQAKVLAPKNNSDVVGTPITKQGIFDNGLTNFPAGTILTSPSGEQFTRKDGGWVNVDGYPTYNFKIKEKIDASDEGWTLTPPPAEELADWEKELLEGAKGDNTTPSAKKTPPNKSGDKLNSALLDKAYFESVPVGDAILTTDDDGDAIFYKKIGENTWGATYNLELPGTVGMHESDAEMEEKATIMFPDSPYVYQSGAKADIKPKVTDGQQLKDGDLYSADLDTMPIGSAIRDKWGSGENDVDVFIKEGQDKWRPKPSNGTGADGPIRNNQFILSKISAFDEQDTITYQEKATLAGDPNAPVSIAPSTDNYKGEVIDPLTVTEKYFNDFPVGDLVETVDEGGEKIYYIKHENDGWSIVYDKDTLPQEGMGYITDWTMQQNVSQYPDDPAKHVVGENNKKASPISSDITMHPTDDGAEVSSSFADKDFLASVPVGAALRNVETGGSVMFFVKTGENSWQAYDVGDTVGAPPRDDAEMAGLLQEFSNEQFFYMETQDFFTPPSVSPVLKTGPLTTEDFENSKLFDDAPIGTKLEAIMGDEGNSADVSVTKTGQGTWEYTNGVEAKQEDILKGFIPLSNMAKNGTTKFTAKFVPPGADDDATPFKSVPGQQLTSEILDELPTGTHFKAHVGWMDTDFIMKKLSNGKWINLTEKGDKSEYNSDMALSVVEDKSMTVNFYDTVPPESEDGGKKATEPSTIDLSKEALDSYPIGTQVTLYGTVLVKGSDGHWNSDSGYPFSSTSLSGNAVGAAEEHKGLTFPANYVATPDTSIIDSTGWAKVSDATGSNPGGTFESPEGAKYYIKHSKSELHAKNEVLADKLYSMAGIDTSNLQLTNYGGDELGTASKILDGATPNLKDQLDNPIYKAKLAEGFAMDAWLANWDVVGMDYDNVMSVDGSPVRVDPGGALLFRAMGDPKGSEFGDEVVELETLLDGSNSKSANAFAGITNEQIYDSISRVEAITPDKIDDLVNSMEFSPEDAANLKQKLKARRANLISRKQDFYTSDYSAKKFAGADANTLTPVTKSAPNIYPNGSGIEYVDLEENKSDPLYGAPAPTAPVAPPVEDYSNPPKVIWDSDGEWLKSVEARYDANTQKKAANVQQSGKWSKIQSVLNGEDQYIDELVTSMYLTPEMADAARVGIKKGIENQDEEKQKWLAKKDAYAKKLASHKYQKTKYNKAYAKWSAINMEASGVLAPKNILPEVSKIPLTEDTEDWSKAHEGGYSLQTAMDSVKNDSAMATHGLSAAIDAEQIKDFDVRVQRVINKSGEEEFRFDLKVTNGWGEEMQKMMDGDSTYTQENGAWHREYVKDSGSNLLKLKDDRKLLFENNATTYHKELDNGVVIDFKRVVGNPSHSYTHLVNSHNNGLTINMPIDSTPEDIAGILKSLGVKAKPTTHKDVALLAENRMITSFGSTSISSDTELFNPEINISGDARKMQLEHIKNKYGVTPADLEYTVDATGRPQVVLSREKAKELYDKSGIKSIYHSLHYSITSNMDSLADLMVGDVPGLRGGGDRHKNGINSEDSGSQSAVQDHKNGAGDHAYTRISRSNNNYKSHGLVEFDGVEIFRQLDLWWNDDDKYGKKEKGSKSPFENLLDKDQYLASDNELLVRKGIPTTMWETVYVGSASQKSELIAKITAKGVVAVNGRSLDELIKVS